MVINSHHVLEVYKGVTSSKVTDRRIKRTTEALTVFGSSSASGDPEVLVLEYLIVKKVDEKTRERVVSGVEVSTYVSLLETLDHWRFPP